MSLNERSPGGLLGGRTPGRLHLRPVLILSVGVLFVLAFTVVYGLLVRLGLGSWQSGAAFGDSFGLANALFAGLAFVGLLATIVLQQRDLDVQREGLERTRGELQRAAEAQESALQQQEKNRWYGEYLAVQSDFSSNMRTLIASGAHAAIYDDLAERGGSKFVAWSSYTQADKAVYAYLEFVYETFERVFVIRNQLPAGEWTYWERWVDDVAGHPILEHVYRDNQGMFDDGFEAYLRGRMDVSKSHPSGALPTP